MLIFNNFQVLKKLDGTCPLERLFECLSKIMNNGEYLANFLLAEAHKMRVIVSAKMGHPFFMVNKFMIFG